MNTIQITRHHSGFANVSDSYSIGNREHEGNAVMTKYRLPEGYGLDDRGIYDSAGCYCEVVAGHDGAPVLMSLCGKCPDVRLVEMGA